MIFSLALHPPTREEILTDQQELLGARTRLSYRATCWQIGLSLATLVPYLVLTILVSIHAYGVITISLLACVMLGAGLSLLAALIGLRELHTVLAVSACAGYGTLLGLLLVGAGFLLPGILLGVLAGLLIQSRLNDHYWLAIKRPLSQAVTQLQAGRPATPAQHQAAQACAETNRRAWRYLTQVNAQDRALTAGECVALMANCAENLPQPTPQHRLVKPATRQTVEAL